MHDISINLVIPVNGEALASSEIIARGVGLPHKSVIQLIRARKSDFEHFGPLAFEMRVVKRSQGGGSPTEYSMLNEHQAILNHKPVIDLPYRCRRR